MLLVLAFLHGFLAQGSSRIHAHVTSGITAVQYCGFVVSMWLLDVFPLGALMHGIGFGNTDLALYLGLVVESTTTVAKLIFLMRHSLLLNVGGSGEIRTHGPISESLVFKTRAIVHSATLPLYLF